MNLLQTTTGPGVEALALQPRGPALRRQRTLSRPVEITGVGMVTGRPVHLRFVPAPIGSGLRFLRTDLSGAPSIPARAESVTGTARRTTLGSGNNQVTLVEHVLASLAGMRIDNCVIELDSVEPPGLDGSAEAYVESLVTGGVELQDAARERLVVTEPVTVSAGGATLSIFPRDGNELVISYLLDYGSRSPIVPQSHTEVITPENFRCGLAQTRTFVLEEEAAELQRQGIGRHLKVSELLVFGPKGLIDNRLRFPDEPARHKILDLVGDLALCGRDLIGHVVAYRSGHPLNVELAKSLTRVARRMAA